MSARISRDENTRSDRLKKDYEDLLAELVGLDLSELGVTIARASRVYSGGKSKADKKVDEGNIDLVKPRFMRGALDNPEAVNVSTRNSSRTETT